ncbi:MAG: T9SS type A sorting domain-containing protein [Chitinophagales bacterium]|nr:T9SS type A sorting domain-containing protein [Chitinophagales bacterium]
MNVNFADWKQQISGHVNNRINSSEDTVYTIQVVVHVVYLNDNVYENIPDDVIHSQITALNRDFNNLNADSVNLRPYFMPFKGKARIKFELAQFAPNGAPSTGITHTKGSLGNLPGWMVTDLLDSNPLLASLLTLAKFEPLKSEFNLITGGSIGKPAWDTKRYLNIWVCDMNYSKRNCRNCLSLRPGSGTLLGMAYPPPNIPHWTTTFIFGTDTIRQDGSLDRGVQNDGVVIDFRAFGINNWFSRDSASQRFRDFYSNGRTPVHEVGHYLGLRHTWGDSVTTTIAGVQISSPPGCVLDDYIDDTPNDKTAFANLVTNLNNICDTTINSCDDPYLGTDYPDMFENYMNYSTDVCYNLFTKQQVDFMRFILTTRRQNIIIKKELEPTLPTTIRNPKMKETGISIYPNPVNDILTLHFDRVINKDVQVDIIDITGKVVLSAVVESNTFDKMIHLKSLAGGIYLIKLSNNDFNTTAKFVKE